MERGESTEEEEAAGEEEEGEEKVKAEVEEQGVWAQSLLRELGSHIPQD